MTDFTLKLNERIVTGKKVAVLRQKGLVPSVVYGGDFAPLSTESLLTETTKIVHTAGKHSPINLVIDGKKKLAIIKNIDIDPVKHGVRHVAFHAIKQNEKIATEVPIVLIGEGESAAEKAGLVVLQAIEKIEIKALPADLPEALEASISELSSSEDKITLEDISLPAGVEYADMEQDMSLVVANVYEPSALQAANEAAGGDAEDDASEVEADNGGDTPQDTQAEETRPGGKKQDEPKQSNVDANK